VERAEKHDGSRYCDECASTHDFILDLLAIPNRPLHQSSRTMPGCKDKKEAIPLVFAGIASTTRHNQLHGNPYAELGIMDLLLQLTIARWPFQVNAY